MPILYRRIAPEYCSFYIAGSRNVEVPIGGELRTVRASRDCLNVSCLYAQNGDTAVFLGRAVDVERPEKPIYDGMLNTQSSLVIIFDANMPEIMSMQVTTVETRVRIWVNRLLEPDKIQIGLG
ncbi:hypothetical protein J1C56_18980 [Aminobacter anthyllidis]|uniref:Uncharacterized protein n=1 Tax=Aminobacter anthyllidis TaxID=1035067 RepID=A0A9X1D5Y8_9HYPH|nr:hypothetical protein [Aminobacter anthyllidis]MBT1157682.1 hypothetical protein [Aminobacter anthyllidis]